MKNAWIILGAIAVILLVLIVSGLGVGMMRFGPGMMGGYGARGFGLAMFPFWCLAGPLFWVLIIAGVVWLIVTQLRKGGGATSGAPRETPLDILKARYAKGEITKEQFEEMKRDLGG